MRVLNNAEMKRLIAAAQTITGLVGPLQQRVAALEASSGSTNAPNGALVSLETRVARLERIESAARSAGAAQ